MKISGNAFLFLALLTPMVLVPLTMQAQSGNTPAPIEITIWYSLFGKAESFYTSTQEQFQKEHPGVIVIFEEHGWGEELRRNLVKALEAGNPPDIVVGENYFQHFAELGALVPLNDAIADIKDNLVPGTHKAAKYKGQIYGLSIFSGVFGFERNCAVIEAAGLDCDSPPKTWDDLLEQAQIISEQGDGQYSGYTLQGPGGYALGSVFRIATYLNQSGASLCKNNCTYPYFNDPRAMPALEFIRKINRYTPPGLTFNPDEAQVYEQLFQGLSAYQIAGSWHPQWAKDSGCHDCRYSSVPIPTNGKPASMIVGNTIFAVLKQSTHPNVAVEWLKFMVSDQVQHRIYPELGRLPSTRSALAALRPDADPATRTFIDELLNTLNLGILPQWRQNPQELWRIYNTLLTQVLTTERPIEDIMNEAQAAAEQVMN